MFLQKGKRVQWQQTLRTVIMGDESQTGLIWVQCQRWCILISSSQKHTHKHTAWVRSLFLLFSVATSAWFLDAVLSARRPEGSPSSVLLKMCVRVSEQRHQTIKSRVTGTLWGEREDVVFRYCFAKLEKQFWCCQLSVPLEKNKNKKNPPVLNRNNLMLRR